MDALLRALGHVQSTIATPMRATKPPRGSLPAAAAAAAVQEAAAVGWHPAQAQQASTDLASRASQAPPAASRHLQQPSMAVLECVVLRLLDLGADVQVMLAMHARQVVGWRQDRFGQCC